ncbi:SGNH/GDSL hydrolase family protein [Lewinella cohaerens]|uniref:SGNH/GDSL hydrolase family protein n=1 Tax=Lewinella cohaerens TaxID=70995 RepID=UPI00035EBACA|nr:SGNH/GDSL hydrolase family protein [Lewinella cohaerens]
MLPKHLLPLWSIVATLGFLIPAVHGQNPVLDTISIDFGSVPSPLPWLNMSNPKEGVLRRLTNQANVATPYSLSVNDAFNKINTEGNLRPDPALVFPGTAAGDSFFGNTAPFEGISEPTGGVILQNLSPQKHYKLLIYAARQSTELRETRYVVKGLTTDTLYLNTSNLLSKGVSARLLPSKTGEITITASSAPRTQSKAGFFYLGALKIIYQPDPPPKPFLRLSSPTEGAYWQVGKSPFITWSTNAKDSVLLGYSTDFGYTWTAIATVAPGVERYEWIIPDEASYACQVRISTGKLTIENQGVFTIIKDYARFPIVVLGSSTAAGTGVSTPDSSWVNRWRAWLNVDTRYELINLAKPGYTTYHILPTGTAIPPQLSVLIDTSRNITHALSFRPKVVLVNMPSNDASYRIPAADQLENFQQIMDTATLSGASAWITTTQPRKFNDLLKVQLQETIRDSIVCIYSNKAIDFWEGLANSDGTIKKIYDSGDYTHMNDRGHALLFKRILASGIIKQQRVTSVDVSLLLDTLEREWLFEFQLPQAGTVDVIIENDQGRSVQKASFINNSGSKQSLRFPARPKSTNSPYLLCTFLLKEENGRITEVRQPIALWRE